MIQIFGITLVLILGSIFSNSFSRTVVMGDADMILPQHVEIPKEVRGIYWTALTAGSKRAKTLTTYMKETGLNTVVIDLKADDGHIAFKPINPNLTPYVADELYIKDLKKVLSELGEQNIYRIARIAVMRDSTFGKVNPDIALKRSDGRLWYDSMGSVWVDPAAPEVADYAIDLAREAYYHGFDEVQFDYVRFPSDGNLKTIRYPIYNESERKTEVMRTFFERVGGTLANDGIPVSFDVFGMTLWSTDDFNIGQSLQDILPYADYISPMVYPSHYPKNFKGYTEPALYPYEIVNESLEEGVALFVDKLQLTDETTFRKSMRPWLQDFDIGAVYTDKRIEAQIKATRDAGASGWILWNARNVYEPATYIK